jgi:Polyketide cyclase / dehydrase and lipid transport
MASEPTDGVGQDAVEGRDSATGRLSYDVHATTSAPIDVVWPLIGEASRWRDWTAFPTAKLRREGTPAPDGVGALRHFGFGPMGSDEEVLAWEPPHHLAYTIVKGYPVRGYRADVELSSRPDGGTAIHWHGRYDAKVPGTGRLLEAVTEALMANFAKRLVRYAERVGERTG